MKYICFILSFIVIALALAPCGDTALASQQSMQITIKAGAEQDHTRHKAVNDSCSPFCQCACCNTSTVSPIIEGSLNIFVCQELSFFPSLTEKVSSNPLNIWQPPKLQS